MKEQTWKKSDVIEMDFGMILKKLIRHWKAMLICGFICALLLGGYRNLTTEKENTKKASETGQSAEEWMTYLSDTEKKSVRTAVALAAEAEQIQKQLEDSVYLNLDPYHVNQATMLYAIDGVSQASGEKILNMYKNYIQSGGLAKEIASDDADYTEEELISLICINQTEQSNVLSTEEQEQQQTQVVIIKDKKEIEKEIEKKDKSVMLSVTVLGKDAEMAENLAQLTTDAIQSYQPTVVKSAGKHTLTLLDQQTGLKSDTELAASIHERKTSLQANTNAVQNATNIFTDIQKEAYQALLVEKGIAAEDKNAVIAETEDNSLQQMLVFVIFGFIGGALLYSCIYAAVYLLRDTLKGEKELKKHYTFPVFGSIMQKKGANGTGEDLSGADKDTFEREKAQLLHRLKLACEKKEITCFLLTTDYTLSVWDKALVESMIKQLKAWGIEVVLAENITGDISLWDEMTQIGQIVMLYKVGETTHQRIDEEMTFYTENDMHVLGAAVIER